MNDSNEAAPTTEEKAQQSTAQAPAIWNPNAAACWSLLFTPIFGSYLMAKNWKALGEGEREAGMMKWFYAAIGVFVVMMLLPEGVGTLPAIVWLLVWYFMAGKKQVDFVKEKHGKEYPRKEWGKPIGIAVGIFVVFVLLAGMFGGCAGDEGWTKESLSGEVTAAITLQFMEQDLPVTCTDVQLVQESDNTYTGFADFDDNTRMPLRVVVDGDKFVWQLNP